MSDRAVFVETCESIKINSEELNDLGMLRPWKYVHLQYSTLGYYFEYLDSQYSKVATAYTACNYQQFVPGPTRLHQLPKQVKINLALYTSCSMFVSTYYCHRIPIYPSVTDRVILIRILITPAS